MITWNLLLSKHFICVCMRACVRVCVCVCVCEAVHSSFYMGWLSFLGLFWSPPSWACAWDQIFLACYDSEHLTWTTSESFSW